MRLVLASYGGRGDVEPAVVVGRELRRRGHDVLMVLPPNLVGFAEGLGLPAAAYGLDSQPILDAQREYWTCYFSTPWRIGQLRRMARETDDFAVRCWADMTGRLAEHSRDADLILTGLIFEQPAVNVAESHDTALATLHFFPVRAHGQLMPLVPPPLSRLGMAANDWLAWRGTRAGEDEQRRSLGLPPATAAAPRRVARRGTLEIQAYEKVVFPRLAAEWSDCADLRPFVGALALELQTAADDDVTAWIGSGSPPVFFGFGSVPIRSPAETLTTIAAACAELGVRGLIGAGSTDFAGVPVPEHVKVVGLVNYATIFPLCRAVVHHGGAGTLAAGLRAGVPQLILWTLPDQPFFASQLRRLKVGTGLRFSSVTSASLAAALRRILDPGHRDRARLLATRVSTPSASATAAADHLEKYLHRRRGTA